MRRIAVFIFLIFLAWGSYYYRVGSQNDVFEKSQTAGNLTSTSERQPKNSVFTPSHKQILSGVEQSPLATQNTPSNNHGGEFYSPRKFISMAPLDKPVEAFASKNFEAKAVVENRSKGAPDSGGVVIQPKDAKGAVFALYQAILWREPDQAGGAAALDAFSRIGWKTYIENAKNMIASAEFFERIAPTHSAEDIINRMYAIFLNRCASVHEMQDHMGSLRDNETGNITNSILNKAIDENKQKIFEGGYKADSCPSLQF